VSFGNVVSGRSIDLPGAESMVGLLVNTVPARVRVPRDEPLLPFLRRLQADRHGAQPHEHASLVDIQGWSEVRGARPSSTPSSRSRTGRADSAPRLRAAALSSSPTSKWWRGERIPAVGGGEPRAAARPHPPLRPWPHRERCRLATRAPPAVAPRGDVRGLDGRVGDLPLLDEAERRGLVAVGTAARREPAAEGTVTRRVREQARLRPDATAVSCGSLA